MCVTCGCGEGETTVPMGGEAHRHAPVHTHADGTTHAHAPGSAHGRGHDHGHTHEHPYPHDHDLQVPGRDARTIALETAVLDKNQVLAERNRTTGAKAVQVNTGTGCHLEADMLGRALAPLKPAPGSMLMIENVGTLVCPALFDLGERARVVIFSVTEGEDKPLKYPHMSRSADVLLLSKTDLLPHLRVDLQRMTDHALTINPALQVFPVSACSGAGLDASYGWLRDQLAGVAS